MMMRYNDSVAPGGGTLRLVEEAADQSYHDPCLCIAP
jgi:hypothetical protein